jgi:hypothetical protein
MKKSYKKMLQEQRKRKQRRTPRPSGFAGHVNQGETDSMTDTSMPTVWWWIAINGPSCAASSVPLPISVVVSPIPEHLLGFRTREEQMTTLRFLLNARLADVETFMTVKIPTKIRSREIVYRRPHNPESFTHGPTRWTVKPTDATSS